MASRRLAMLSAAVSLAWIVFLGWMAVRTANPVVLNARQILESRYVVVGSVDQGQVHVARVFAGQPPDAPFQIKHSEPLPTGELILPLVRDEFRELRVTPTRLPRGDRLVYPANEETLRQLSDILRQRP